MDLLFVRLFEWARDQGMTRVDLGLSALAGVGEEPEDPLAEKALRLVYEYGNSFYGFKGLHGFKDKFRPEWQARYIVVSDTASLPVVLTALIRLNAGESPGALLTERLRRLTSG
jgi:phosphatidylglycerol lysyltransferase